MKNTMLNQPEIKNYFQTLLASTKIHPESFRRESKNNVFTTPDKNLDVMNINDPFMKNNETILSNSDLRQPSFRGSPQEKFNNQDLPTSSLDPKNNNFGNVAKKLGDFTTNAMNNQEKNYQNEYLQGLSTAYRLLDMQGSNHPLLRVFKQLIFLNIQLSIFLMNLLSIVNLIILTDIRLGVLDYETYGEPMKMAEWALLGFFTFEIALCILSGKGGLFKRFSQILSFNNISNILLMSEIISTTMYSEGFIRKNGFFIMVFVLRSFKLIKLRMIIQYTLKQLKKLILNDTNQSESFSSQNELKYFVYNSAIDIIIAIFIEATGFLAVDEALEYRGYGQQIKGKFDYIGASYYSIVSLTTIGYGDIYPMLWSSRLYTICILFFNISVLSSFLSKMTEKIYQISPYIRNFYFNNHIIIIGELPLTFLKYFIKELHLCDVLTSDIYNKDNINKRILSKIILVGRENPTKDLEKWLEDFSTDYIEIRYLKSNFLETIWMKQTNLQSARHLFAFSMNLNENQAQALESDKQMAFNVQKVLLNYENVETTLVLSSEFSNQIKKDSLWANATVISAEILNEYLMANSLENQGLNTWLTHLATLREKSIPTGSELNNLEEYAINMSQELYPISKTIYKYIYVILSNLLELPQFYNGKSFDEAVKMTYFCTVDLSDSFSYDYTNPVQIKASNLMNKSGILLIGIEYKEISTNITKFLINPLHYKIQNNDIGYVVAYDQNHAKSITNLSLKSPQYSTYMKNMNFFKRSKVSEKCPKYLDLLSKSMNQRLADWSMKKTKYLKKKNTNLNDTNSKLTDIPDIFNLHENNSPKGIFKNHVIIKGNLHRLDRIASVLRTYSLRPILLFSDAKANPSEWHKIRERFKNVYYVYGNPTNVNHVMQIDPKKAFKILILSVNHNNYILDSESIVFTRIIADFFELSNFLTELMDENNLKFLSINPKYPNMDYYFWPFFVRGSVHFSSLAMSILAKTIINKNWLSFIRNLAKPNHEHDEKDEAENEKINTLILTLEAAKEFQLYGHLQYALMCHKPSVIAIALIKLKIKQNDDPVSSLLRKTSRSRLRQSGEVKPDFMINDHISRIMNNFYGSEFVMTNPSFLTPLEEGDKVLIIGNINIEENDKNVMTMSCSRLPNKLNSIGQSPNDIFVKNISEKSKTRTRAGCVREGFEDAINQLNGLIKLIINNWEDIKSKKDGSPLIM